MINEILDDKKYNFWILLKKFNIIIPIIQRDYVQGMEDDNINQIRENLLEDIKNSIHNNEPMEFDFIYGSTDEDNNLSLLDGQQRMTTLFLLYWYFASKENKLNEEVRNMLKKFSYKNRISTRDFCKNLLEHDIVIKKDEDISEIIKNKTWFFFEWEKDPTVKNMLHMLNCINKKMYNEEAFDKLTNNENNLISFYFRPLEKFNLTDDLYIKMNSRGKKLTNFEIFKSKIIEIMKKYKQDDLLIEFKNNIDNKWTDLLWEYRDKQKNTIDKPFIRLIYFITEMIYAIKIDKTTEKDQNQTSPFIYNGQDVIIDVSLIEEVYKDKSNTKLLIDILNIWKTKEEIDTDFYNTFCSKYTKGKVSLYEEEINLFERCLYGNKFELREKQILFAFILRKLKFNVIDSSMCDFIRIVRNILESRRWFSRPQETYANNIRFFRIKEIFAFFEIIMNEKNVYKKLSQEDIPEIGFIKPGILSEIEKAKMVTQSEILKDTIFKCEDMKATKGIINNFINIIEKNPTEFNEFIEIFDNSHYYVDIYRILLLFEDYGIDAGSKDFYGDGNSVYNVITYEPQSGINKVKLALEKFFNEYLKYKTENIEQTLNNIIENNLSNLDKENWRYYLVKYKQIWLNSENEPEERYSFILNRNDNGEVQDNINIGYLNKKMIYSWHINMYYKMIVSQYDLNFKDCYTKDEDNGIISLKNGITIELMYNGFKISIYKEESKKKLNKLMDYSVIDNNLYMVDFDENMDIIEQEQYLMNKLI